MANMDNQDGEFFVLDSYSVDDTEDKAAPIINIQWEAGGIKCPVSQCSVTFCTSQHTFSRHWEETHNKWFHYQVCPECGHELKRFIELQQHMRQKHGIQGDDFSTVLPSVEVRRVINVNYIDPGQYRPPSFASKSNSYKSRIKALKGSNNNNLGNQIKGRDSYTWTKAQNSLLSKRKSKSSTAVIKPKIKNKNEEVNKSDDQSTTSLPEWTLPDIPSDRQLLVDYLKWADSIICQVGNSRLEAKHRLEALDMDSELQKERELRIKLEKELEAKKAELEALQHLSDYTSISVD